MRTKSGQSGIEYLIIIGFVTLAITIILITAYFYMGLSRDKINMNHIEVMANKIISSSESVFFSSSPSQTTIIVYIPKSIKFITLQDYNLIITASTSSGTTKRAFPSRVKLQGSISVGEGSRKLTIKAEEDYVSIS